MLSYNKPLQKIQNLLQQKNQLRNKQYKRMSLQIEENVGKILKNQNSKRNIESKLRTKRVKKGNDPINNDRIQLGFMMFQVVKDGIITDHIHSFPCVFQLRGEDSRGRVFERQQRQVPKVGSFIRTKKMDFDLINFNLVIYDYQYLGGAGSTVSSMGHKVNWNSETISQIIRRNNTVKGGQIILDSYINDHVSQKQPFEYPDVQFITVKLMQQILTQHAQVQNNMSAQNVEKITAPKQNTLNMTNEEKQVSHVSESINEEKEMNENQNLIKDLQL